MGVEALGAVLHTMGNPRGAALRLFKPLGWGTVEDQTTTVFVTP